MWIRLKDESDTTVNMSGVERIWRSSHFLGEVEYFDINLVRTSCAYSADISYKSEEVRNADYDRILEKLGVE